MSHDHDHDHDHHHHHHHHDHDHTHDHDQPAPLPFADKLVKRLENWHRHNQDHLQDYQHWADQASVNGHGQVADRLLEVVDLSRKISDSLARALADGRSRT